MRLDHKDDLRIMQYDRLENISESFKKLQGYYQYVRYRKYSGKLTEEQISRCKEGNVRGAFGYPESTEKIAQLEIFFVILHENSVKLWINYFF